MPNPMTTDPIGDLIEAAKELTDACEEVMGGCECIPDKPYAITRRFFLRGTGNRFSRFTR